MASTANTGSTLNNSLSVSQPLEVTGSGNDGGQRHDDDNVFLPSSRRFSHRRSGIVNECQLESLQRRLVNGPLSMSMDQDVPDMSLRPQLTTFVDISSTNYQQDRTAQMMKRRQVMGGYSSWANRPASATVSSLSVTASQMSSSHSIIRTNSSQDTVNHVTYNTSHWQTGELAVDSSYFIGSEHSKTDKFLKQY